MSAHIQDGTGQDNTTKERIWSSTGGGMLEQEMTTEQDRSGMSREQLESALAQREDQLRRSRAKLEVMQEAEPILRSEIREYKSALKEAKDALENAGFGKYTINEALSAINKVLVELSGNSG